MNSKFLPFLRKRGTKVTYEVTGTGSFEVSYSVGDPLKGEQKQVKAGVTPWKQDVVMSGIDAMPMLTIITSNPEHPDGWLQCTISIDGELAVEGAVSSRSASATFTALPGATG
ncbi:hypothetical protein ABZZ17_24945 [Streptomyces sp. NPDC006512]|uniref:hypothetical protein n=1 Tax=Streptomyces sp. NPDC006512 TaxID=3154307 RepID=UPI0033A12B51